jgi:hypothetical protein
VGLTQLGAKIPISLPAISIHQNSTHIDHTNIPNKFHHPLTAHSTDLFSTLQTYRPLRPIVFEPADLL